MLGHTTGAAAAQKLNEDINAPENILFQLRQKGLLDASTSPEEIKAAALSTVNALLALVEMLDKLTQEGDLLGVDVSGETLAHLFE